MKDNFEFQKKRESIANAENLDYAPLSKSLPAPNYNLPPVQRKENNTGMSNELKDKMEGSFGTDFSDVRLHTNSGSANELGALAYTQGSDVHFAPGQYNPNSSSGQELLGHELSHVVQQKQGRVNTTHQEKGKNINDATSLESEADNHGKIAARGGVINTVPIQQKSNNGQAYVQKKNAPIQMFRMLPTGATVLGINPDLNNIYLACKELAVSAAGSYGNNVNWGHRLGPALESRIATNSLAAFSHSFTETDGWNYDWTVSIRWKIQNIRTVGGQGTGTVNRTGGGSSTTGNSNTNGTTTELGGEAGIGGHEGGASGGVNGSVGSSNANTNSGNASVSGGVARSGSENVQSYIADLVAEITVDPSMEENAFSVTIGGLANLASQALDTTKSGAYKAGTVEYEDSRPRR